MLVMTAHLPEVPIEVIHLQVPMIGVMFREREMIEGMEGKDSQVVVIVMVEDMTEVTIVHLLLLTVFHLQLLEDTPEVVLVQIMVELMSQGIGHMIKKAGVMNVVLRGLRLVGTVPQPEIAPDPHPFAMDGKKENVDLEIAASTLMMGLLVQVQTVLGVSYILSPNCQ